MKKYKIIYRYNRSEPEVDQIVISRSIEDALRVFKRTFKYESITSITEVEPELGAAKIVVTLANGEITVTHGWGGDLIIKRPAISGDWDKLLDLLSSKKNFAQ